MAQTSPAIKLKIRRPNKVLVAVVGVALVLCIVAMAAVCGSLADQQQRLQGLKEQALRLEQENAELEDKIDSVGSVNSVEQIAGEELGLVDPDSVIIQPAN